MAAVKPFETETAYTLLKKHMTLFQAPRTWTYIRKLISLYITFVSSSSGLLSRFLQTGGQGLPTSLSATVSLHWSRFTTGGAACLGLAQRPVRLTAHVTKQSAAASRSSFPHHVSISHSKWKKNIQQSYFMSAHYFLDGVALTICLYTKICHHIAPWLL